MAALETGNAFIVSCIICRTNSHSILACPYLPGAQEFSRNASYAPRASNRSRRHSKRSTPPKQHTAAPSIIPEFAGNASSSTQDTHSPLQLDARHGARGSISKLHSSSQVGILRCLSIRTRFDDPGVTRRLSVPRWIPPRLRLSPLRWRYISGRTLVSDRRWRQRHSART